MKPAHLLALYKLAELGASEKDVSSSTTDVARGIGVSQQTASRRLIEMEKLGLIERVWEGRNQRIRITKEGLSNLTGMYQVLRRAFEAPRKELVMNAAVFSGLAEGSYYMSLEGYRKQFKSKLGFNPFPGTLNLKVRKQDLGERRLLESYPFIPIEGFANEKRSYGGAKCYKAIVDEKARGAILIPIRAHYGEDVVEIISPESLRKRLRLKDGDVVRIRVLLES